jgi:hypothetical protein
MTRQEIELLTFISLIHLQTLEIVIIYMKRKVVQIIGGSASTAYALDEGHLPWPELIGKRFPELEIRHINQPLMTLVQSINHIQDLETSDLLVLHFGTSVGWPEPVVKIGHKFGMDLHNDHSFQQPPKKYSGTLKRRLGKSAKLKIRNLIKYLLFLLGLYKPRASLKEMGDQVGVVARIARQKAEKVIWIQHQSIQTSRIVLERSLYRHYYREIISALSPMVSENFKVLQLPKNFLRAENYLLDGVHLTAQGHKELADLIEEKFAGLLSD